MPPLHMRRHWRSLIDKWQAKCLNLGWRVDVRHSTRHSSSYLAPNNILSAPMIKPVSIIILGDHSSKIEEVTANFFSVCPGHSDLCQLIIIILEYTVNISNNLVMCSLKFYDFMKEL